MDGVLTACKKQFDTFFKEGYWDVVEEKKGREYGLKLVDEAGVDFWTTMEWIDGGKELWEYIKNHNVTILSDPKEFTGAKEGKRIWIKEHLGDYTSILTGKKSFFARGHTILIDDLEKNIQLWENNGGIGILHSHKDVGATIEKLKELGL